MKRYHLLILMSLPIMIGLLVLFIAFVSDWIYIDLGTWTLQDIFHAVLISIMLLLFAIRFVLSSLQKIKTNIHRSEQDLWTKSGIKNLSVEIIDDRKLLLYTDDGNKFEVIKSKDGEQIRAKQYNKHGRQIGQTMVGYHTGRYTAAQNMVDMIKNRVNKSD